MDSREAFEAWMSDDGMWPKAVERNSDGVYVLMDVASKWTAWQKATERAAKVCEDARDNIWEYHESVVKRTAQDVCENLAAAIRAAAPPQCTAPPPEPQ